MSEMDEISRQTGATFRDVLNVARQWLYTLKRADTNAPKKLTRKERRELGQHIVEHVNAQRIATAWYTKRVGDYRSDYATARARRESDPFYSPQDAAADRERLYLMRLRIEEGLQNSALPIERRGQVVLALDRAQSRSARTTPSQGEVFPRMSAQAAQEARNSAVESEKWVAATVKHLDYEVSSMVVDTAGTMPSTFDLGRAKDMPARDWSRANAIQQIRHAQNRWLAERAGGGTPSEQAETNRRLAAEQAAAAGIPIDHVQWEFANAEANSRCQVTVESSAPDGTTYATRAYFPAEPEAAQFARDMFDHNPWKAGTEFRVSAHESGRRQPFYTSEGTQAQVARSAQDWQRDVRPARTDPPDYDHAHAGTTGTGSEPGPREKMLARGLDAVTAERDQLKARLDSVTAEVETLKNSQLIANNDLKTLRQQVDTLAKDRDQFRGERDEAVRKLAQRTPEQERFGSRERVDAERNGGSGNGHSTSRSTVAEGLDEASKDELVFHVVDQIRNVLSARGVEIPESLKKVTLQQIRDDRINSRTAQAQRDPIQRER
ncbi:hypothetical protein [Nocardia sp. NPDC056000]|uniref:hypothetical protein n=1 Tax=Nocardia sp. NPDC056000 TaxID=3345674 RepID=UPI0035D73EDA